MDKIIKLTDTSDLGKIYEEHGVSANRIKNLDANYQPMPDKFTVLGMVFPKVLFGDNKEPVTIPAFAIDEDGGYVPVNQIFASYVGNISAASKITKDTPNKNKWMCVSNKKVSDIAKNKSERQFTIWAQGKTFTAGEAESYPTYSGIFSIVDGKRTVTFHETEIEAIKAIVYKDYRKVSLVE